MEYTQMGVWGILLVVCYISSIKHKLWFVDCKLYFMKYKLWFMNYNLCFMEEAG